MPLPTQNVKVTITIGAPNNHTHTVITGQLAEAIAQKTGGVTLRETTGVFLSGLYKQDPEDAYQRNEGGYTYEDSIQVVTYTEFNSLGDLRGTVDRILANNTTEDSYIFDVTVSKSVEFRNLDDMR